MGVKKIEKVRVMITMDKRLVDACDKYINKLIDSDITTIDTKSKLVEQALLCYFATLEDKITTETKGENDHAN